jgi:3-(3-hydroxy-phenyl)propionate hydroxylase
MATLTSPAMVGDAPAVEEPTLSDPIYDIVIAGMGPVGAAAAIFAGRAGLRTCVVDKSVDVYPLPRATHFDAEIMRLFQRAGLVETLAPLVTTYNGGLHLGADGEPIRDFRVPAARNELGWFPHYTFLQPRLEHALRAAAGRLDSVKCELGVEVVGLHQDDADTVTATLQGPGGNLETVRAHYAIACDGATSPVRKSLGIALQNYGFEEPWIIVDTLVSDPAALPDHSVMYCDPVRPATYIPQPGNHRRWEFMLLDGETPEVMETPSSIHQLLKPHVDVEKVEIVRSAVYRFHGLITSSWRVGRIFLAGDAAHQTPPFYGQGMCHGIRDVANLVWKLEHVLRNPNLFGLLDTYATERHPHVKSIIDASVENGRYICILDPDEARARDERLRARAAAGADVRSFRSVIPGIVDGVLSPMPHAVRGQLMIQPDVLTPAGDIVPLDEVLGAGFALITVDPCIDGHDLEWFNKELGGRVVRVGGRAELGGRADVHDINGALDAWFVDNQVSSALIRPDRYVFGVNDGLEATSRLLTDLRQALTSAHN